MRAALDGSEPGNLDAGAAFDEWLRVDGSERTLRVTGSGGAFTVRVLPAAAPPPDVGAELAAWRAFLSGPAPAVEKRAALMRLYRLGRDGVEPRELFALARSADETLDGGAPGERLELGAAVAQAIAAVARDREATVADRDWVGAHLLAAKRFQWAGDYLHAGVFLERPTAGTWAWTIRRSSS